MTDHNNTTTNHNHTSITEHNMTITAEQATRTQTRVKNRETFDKVPALLPVVHVERRNNQSGDGYRFHLSAQGFPGTIVVWSNHADAFAKAWTDAPKTDTGATLLPVLLTATETEPTSIEGHTMPGYYNLSAMPCVTIAENPFA